MHDANKPTFRSDEGVPTLLIEDLKALYGRKLEVPAHLDWAIRGAARQKIGARRTRKRAWARRLAPFAAAACIALVSLVGLRLNRSPESLHLGYRTQPVGVATIGGRDPRPSVVGQVYAANAASDPDPGTPLYPLLAGQRLEAPDDSPLTLRVGEGHAIRIEPGTRLAADRNAADGYTIALAAGRITATVRRARDEGEFRVITPHATVTVTGTIFTVGTGFERTRVRVTEGGVTLTTADGRAQHVSANQSWQTDGFALARSSEPADTLLDPLLQSQRNLKTAARERAFRAQFAPLHLLRDHLSANGHHADDLELLAVSAELWNVQYPKLMHMEQASFVHRRAGLERAARWFGHKVEWLAPADPADAARLARESLDRGALVLAFGRPGEPVQAIETNHLDCLAKSESWLYRFLGERAPHALPMCRIVPDETTATDRRQLAREAIEDAQRLLTGMDDAHYWVGALAVDAWSRRWAAEADLDLQDPFLRVLDVLANLGPHCWSRLHTRTGPPSGSRTAPAAYAQLNLAVLELFTTSALADTPCDAATRTQLVDQLSAALGGVIVSSATH